MVLFFKLIASILLAYFVGKKLEQEPQHKRKAYYWITALAFFFYMAFRNAIYVDYDNYVNLYDKIYTYVERQGFFVIFTPSFIDEVSETGFALLNLLVRFVFGDVIFVFIISALLTILPLWSFFKRSPYFLLSVFLYLTIGTYVEGFNIMRQMIAASLVMCGYQFIKSREFWKYCLCVVGACLFHSTAAVMIPAYFILCPLKGETIFHRRIRRRYFAGVGLAAVLLIGPVVNLIVDVLYGGSYGYEAGITPLKWTNAVVPTACFVLCEVLLHLKPKCRRYSNPDNEALSLTGDDYIILESGVMSWYIIQLCRMQIPLMTRFSCFFNPFLLLLLPVCIYNCPYKKVRRFVTVGLVGCLFLFMLWSFRDNPLNDYQSVFFDLFR